MENERLIEKPFKPKLFCSHKCTKISAIIVFTILIVLQSLCLIYLVTISNTAQKLNLYNLNTTNVNMYINKTEKIIDYICDNYIKC